MKFKYVAKNQTGQTIRGEADAASQQAVAQMLREQKLLAIKISAVGGGLSLGMVNNLLGRVGSSEMANFTRQLATMINAGLPLTDSLNLLKIQSSPALSPVVAAILADVQAGQALSAAMGKHPRIFSAVYVALIKAGETAGVMEKILLRLADTSERNREFRAKVMGAMIYPVIILIGMVGVTALMMLLVIPQLSALYADFGAELPIATKMVIGMSDFSVKFWWLILIVAGLGLYGWRAYINTVRGRYQWDTFLYKIPVAGPLAKQVMLTELTRTLSLLVGAGVSVVEALNIVADSVGNVVVKKQVQQIAKQVEKGFPISISFSESEVFPPLVGQMIAVGEETGKLDEVLTKLSSYFESESSEKVKGLTSAIEPIILVILAVGVGFLMYAIIIPIYGITNQI